MKEGVGSGRVAGQVRCEQFHEFPFPSDGAETRVIVPKAVKNAEPVLAIVDLQSLEGTEPIVRLDELRRDVVHAAAIGPMLLHPPLRREWTEQRGGHNALQLAQFRRAADLTRRSWRAVGPVICCL